ncbi:MAG: major facilitator superfamily [Lasallia pustulata]|uniref:Major facilitator superfamily n=1 Tax=Lasallia pustulata TaxID=136370 RepID=A0A5M8PZ48_9LECA|nr:MAG: major facilitator superfamily [Lasallia pustulata]
MPRSAPEPTPTASQPSPPSPAAPPPPTPELYTTFTRAEKRLLTLLLGFATTTSPLTATIYLPLLPLLRAHFHTSAQAVNLTITLYIIFQALSPAIFGPLSDSLGRRPVYLLTLALYMLANLGLALNKHSYGVLLGLRTLQSLGASAASAVSYGVVADVCVPAERGSMLGPISMLLNLGACVGPVVGGLVAFTSGSYEWVFWALVVAGGVLLCGVGAFLPETARKVVGNGSASTRQKWWERSWWSLGKRWIEHRGENGRDADAVAAEDADDRPLVSFKRRFRIPNPLACFRIIFHRDTFCILWLPGSFYVVDYSFLAAIPDIYKTLYHFNELQIGLCYLPRGAGIIIGGYFNGKLMDHNYRVTARKLGHLVDKVSGDDLTHFPIERARARGTPILLVISTATIVGYGWAVSRHAPLPVLLLLQFVQGFWGTCFFNIYNALLVDVFPDSPSTAAAAASVTRCAMAAAGGGFAAAARGDRQSGEENAKGGAYELVVSQKSGAVVVAALKIRIRR